MTAHAVVTISHVGEDDRLLTGWGRNARESTMDEEGESFERAWDAAMRECFASVGVESWTYVPPTTVHVSSRGGQPATVRILHEGLIEVSTSGGYATMICDCGAEGASRDADFRETLTEAARVAKAVVQPGGVPSRGPFGGRYLTFTTDEEDEHSLKWERPSRSGRRR